MANRRYLEMLAVVDDPTPIHRVLDPISQPVTKRGPRARALRPVAPEEAAIFQAILRGEHSIRGFTNRDVQAHLFADPRRDKRERRRRCSWVNRRLRLLRRHGLIIKVGNRHLYRVTAKGNRAMTTALALREANLTYLRAA